MRFSFTNSFPPPINSHFENMKGKKNGEGKTPTFSLHEHLKFFHFNDFPFQWFYYEDLVFPHLLSSSHITSLLPCYWTCLPFLPVFLYSHSVLSVHNNGQLEYIVCFMAISTDYLCQTTSPWLCDTKLCQSSKSSWASKSKDNLVWSPWELIQTSGFKNGKATQAIELFACFKLEMDG